MRVATWISIYNMCMITDAWFIISKKYKVCLSFHSFLFSSPLLSFLLFSSPSPLSSSSPSSFQFCSLLLLFTGFRTYSCLCTHRSFLEVLKGLYGMTLYGLNLSTCNGGKNISPAVLLLSSQHFQFVHAKMGLTVSVFHTSRKSQAMTFDAW